jgi:hypothetical protein
MIDMSQAHAWRDKIQAPATINRIDNQQTLLKKSLFTIEAPCSKLQGIFDRKECGLFYDALAVRFKLNRLIAKGAT